jgi:hypothetical protein
MRVDGLLIPDALTAALDAGRWPRTHEEANQQNLQSRVSLQGVQQLAPGEDRLFLYHPPFGVLARGLVGEGDLFYNRFGALDQIVPELTIEIADFGLGSDAPVALDYRDSTEAPRVIRLQWRCGGQSNHLVQMAPNFATFAAVLGL